MTEFNHWDIYFKHLDVYYEFLAEEGINIYYSTHSKPCVLPQM